MKKFLSLALFTTLFLVACEPPSEEEQLNSAIDEALEVTQAENQEFVEENKGGTPEDVLETRYQELIKTYSEDYGMPDENTGLNYAGERIYGHADILEQKVGLDYNKLSYVQFLSGTSGMNSLVEAMDSSAPGVKEVQEMFEQYDAITDYDPVYFESIMPEGLSDDEKVAFIVKSFADLYRVFREPYDSTGMSEFASEDMKQIQADTGLDEDDLRTIFAYGFPELIAEAFPDSWAYKIKFIELAKY